MKVNKDLNVLLLPHFTCTADRESFFLLCKYLFYSLAKPSAVTFSTAAVINEHVGPQGLEHEALTFILCSLTPDDILLRRV